MALTNVIELCNVIDALLFEHTLCVNYLFACKSDHLHTQFFSKQLRDLNVNLSNEFYFSEVHGAMNRSGWLAKLT